MIQRSDLCVLIPAYNEEKTLPKIITEIRTLGYPLHVVDDGSKDGTARILREMNVSHHSVRPNAGKGAAIKRGFEWFLTQPYQAAVIMDADGQHLTQELDDFLDALNRTGADLVLGNRMGSAANMPWIRVKTNRFMSWLLSRVAGQAMPDTQCGYRALTRRAVQCLRIETSRFEAESEMLLQVARAGYKITSTPITSVYRDEVSHIHPLRDTLRFFLFLAKFLIKKS